MDTIQSIKFEVDVKLINDIELTLYSQEPNPLIEWLIENVGPKYSGTIWPCSGKHWKCWLVFDPNNQFRLSWCQVEFDSAVEDSIISMFILQWT